MPKSTNEDELEVARGYVLCRSTLRGIRVPKAGGDPEPFDAKYFDVLRKKSGGGWEFTRRMWSSNLKE